jgi:hypothetical protein
METVHVDFEGVFSGKLDNFILLGVEVDVAVGSSGGEDEVRGGQAGDDIYGYEFLQVVEEGVAEFVEFVEEGVCCTALVG